jgi:hypothetical protein
MSESSASSPDSALSDLETLTREEYDLFFANFMTALNNLPPEPNPQPSSGAVIMEGCDQQAVLGRPPFLGAVREGGEGGEGSQTISPPTPGLLSQYVVADVLRDGMDPRFEEFKFFD